MTNFRETGALIGFDVVDLLEPGATVFPVVYWHEPTGRTAGALPDDHTLWAHIWQHRENLTGFAHTHPGGGAPPAPSHEDLTTFYAVERALGQPLIWWIVNATHAVWCEWNPNWYANPAALPAQRYTVTAAAPQPWMDELRRRSNI